MAWRQQHIARHQRREINAVKLKRREKGVAAATVSQQQQWQHGSSCNETAAS